MTVFYVFNEYGNFQFTTTDENYASVWCNNNNGVLMKIKKTPKRGLTNCSTCDIL